MQLLLPPLGDKRNRCCFQLAGLESHASSRRGGGREGTLCFWQKERKRGGGSPVQPRRRPFTHGRLKASHPPRESQLPPFV